MSFIRILQNAVDGATDDGAVTVGRWFANIAKYGLVGIVVMAGVLVLTYVVSYVADRFFSGRVAESFNALHNNNQRFVAGGVVARDAGLTCMTKDERRQVLSHVLPSQPFTEELLKEQELSRLARRRSKRKSLPIIREEAICDRDLTLSDNNSNDEEAHLDNNNNHNDTSEEQLSPSSNISATEPSTIHTDDDNGDNIDESDEGEQQLAASCGPFDAEHSKGCAICLSEYVNDERVIVGRHCSHMFHKDCLLDWLDNHDVCPYCRIDMLTSEEMRQGAMSTFGEEHFREILGRDPLHPPANSPAAMVVGSALTASPEIPSPTSSPENDTSPRVSLPDDTTTTETVEHSESAPSHSTDEATANSISQSAAPDDEGETAITIVERNEEAPCSSFANEESQVEITGPHVSVEQQ